MLKNNEKEFDFTARRGRFKVSDLNVRSWGRTNSPWAKMWIPRDSQRALSSGLPMRHPIENVLRFVGSLLSASALRRAFEGLLGLVMKRNRLPFRVTHMSSGLESGESSSFFAT